jgi:hypothetical protein
LPGRWPACSSPPPAACRLPHALPSRLGPRLAPAPGCCPPERMPPPKAGASRQGERDGRAVMTSSSDPIASPAPDTNVKLRGPTPKSCGDRPQKVSKCGDRPQNAGPSSRGWRVSRQAVCGASRPANWGQMLKCGDRPHEDRADLLKCGDRPQIRGARAPQVPPWASPCSCSRLPPAGADDTAEGGRITAGRMGGTGGA